ncbi:MAG: C-GCAxxG-C-C family protein [Candidatus Vecturithrix sp.]|jgi:C_GCAxxG_C_C family probable redox protein|nr:C-GCAxxG-C-C family protein [Candidatus Vecturithrix sp.]
MMMEENSKNALLDQIEKTAYEYEKNFHGCSRCVVKAIQDHLDIGDESNLKASTPFAAGVAMRGETCGALLGGLLILGVVTASTDMKDAAAMTNAMAAGFRLARKVEKELGSTNCTELQKANFGKFYSIADPVQYEAFVKAGGYEKCSKVCGKIARITASFIMEYQDKVKR